MRPKAARLRGEAEPACAASRRRGRGFDDSRAGQKKPPGVSFESRAAEWSRRESNPSPLTKLGPTYRITGKQLTSEPRPPL
jgi:hypothetical protein